MRGQPLHHRLLAGADAHGVRRPPALHRHLFLHLSRLLFHRRRRRRDADGYYWITGRVDDVINVSGHRIGTAEVESAWWRTPRWPKPPSSAARTTSRARASNAPDQLGDISTPGRSLRGGEPGGPASGALTWRPTARRLCYFGGAPGAPTTASMREVPIADDHPLFRDAPGRGDPGTAGGGPVRRRERAGPAGAGRSASGKRTCCCSDLHMPGRVIFPPSPPARPATWPAHHRRVGARGSHGGAARPGAWRPGYIPKSSAVESIVAAIRTVLDGDVWLPPQLATGAAS